MDGKVSVCICTYRRPDALARLLDALGAQTRRPDEIVVVDNHAGGGARAVCEGAAIGVPVRYAIEAEQNIALARNRAVAMASGDWLGFLDDDELPGHDWLEQLLATAERHAADGVLAPVSSEVPDNAPQWIRRGQFFARRRFATGTVVPRNEFRIGNALIRADCLRSLDPVFDPAFGRTGGEDGDALSRLAAAGARLVWCDEAVVREPVEFSRLNLRWLLMRSFRGGQDYGRHFLAGRYGANGPLRRALFIARATLVLFVSALLCLPALLFGRHRAVQWLRRAYAQLGKLAAFSSYRYEEYRG